VDIQASQHAQEREMAIGNLERASERYPQLKLLLQFSATRCKLERLCPLLPQSAQLVRKFLATDSRRTDGRVGFLKAASTPPSRSLFLR
jgi:hypothetical protein